MKVEVIKDATLTVMAGQVIEIREDQVAAAVQFGFVKPCKEEKPKKAKK